MNASNRAACATCITYYIAFDLARFVETGPLKPTDEDRGILRAILDLARTADPKLSPGKLQKAITGLRRNTARPFPLRRL